jgi:uncharacterized membrane protein (UPF0127 family)
MADCTARESHYFIAKSINCMLTPLDGLRTAGLLFKFDKRAVVCWWMSTLTRSVRMRRTSW